MMYLLHNSQRTTPHYYYHYYYDHHHYHHNYCYKNLFSINNLFFFFIFSYNNLSLSKGVLKKIIEAATAETTARTLCQLGDDLIEEETGKVYKKEKELKKGIY